ncbi:MAG: methyl-accepting chemotaxis protein [Treponema sp.]|jgi:hypothetical protein|nr:methyl-accepting chemotaxis protein [Treponema sp.]
MRAVKNVSTSLSVRMKELIQSIDDNLGTSVNSIDSITNDLNVLAINARIQAARIGAAGTGFKVIAHEMESLVSKTRGSTVDLKKDVVQTIHELENLQTYIATQVRGQRLVHSAETCMDIIDRNLYERSCDVRWWATGNSVYEAALDPTNRAKLNAASQRMTVILESYTVYFDLVLCDIKGTIICNGRPERFKSVGIDVSKSEWFTNALKTTYSSEFSVEGPFVSPLANGKPVLMYSCGVRSQGALVGVFGVVFNWDNLAEKLLKQIHELLISETEFNVELWICRQDGTVVASTDPQWRDRKIPFNDINSLCSETKHFHLADDSTYLVAVAPSQGYETYKTEWITVIAEYFSH